MNTILKVLNQVLSHKIDWGNNEKGRIICFIKLKIRRLLKLISRDQLVNMLKIVLNKSEKSDIQHKYLNSLSLMSIYSNKLPPKERHNIIRPLKQSGLSLKDVKALGFTCSNDLWKSCLEENKRNKGGRRPVSQDILNHINDSLEAYSVAASNRTIKSPITKEVIPVRYRSDTLVYIYNNSHVSNEISYSTFSKHVAHQFKKPHRLTDLCDYCEYGKSLYDEIIRELINLDYSDLNIEDRWSSCDTKKFIDYLKQNNFINEINKNLHQKILNLREIIYHKQNSIKQRDVYNEMRKNKDLLKGNLLIDFDFKQKIVIGKGPRLRNSEYFQLIQRSLLGS